MSQSIMSTGKPIQPQHVRCGDVIRIHDNKDGDIILKVVDPPSRYTRSGDAWVLDTPFNDFFLLEDSVFLIERTLPERIGSVLLGAELATDPPTFTNLLLTTNGWVTQTGDFIRTSLIIAFEQASDYESAPVG